MAEIPAIIEVKWIDSLVLEHGEWMDRDNLDLSNENMLHSSVGYLVAESDVAICLASSHNDQPHEPINRISGGVVIPKVAITNTNVLREKTDDSAV
jgi:hypothetical protein